MSGGNTPRIFNTGWSKSLCAPDDYTVIVRCTETFLSPCIIPRWRWVAVTAYKCHLLQQHNVSGGSTPRIFNTGWSKSLCAPDDYTVIVRCTETFWSPCIIPRWRWVGCCTVQLFCLWWNNFGFPVDRKQAVYQFGPRIFPVPFPMFSKREECGAEVSLSLTDGHFGPTLSGGPK